MKTVITKSLFVDYCDFPKLARWKVNDSEIYKKIRKIESEEQEDHIISIWQTVENVVLQYLSINHQSKPINLMPEVIGTDFIVDEDEQEQDDFIYFPIEWVNSWEVITHNTNATIQAIKNKEKILYQPWFTIDWCFVRADFMVLQPNGQYDLIEVKAKSWIRKDVTHEGISYKEWEIDKKFINDVSFQKLVINKVLESEWLPTIWNVYIYYLNKDYIRLW